MKHPDNSSEQSMEEILASIRSSLAGSGSKKPVLSNGRAVPSNAPNSESQPGYSGTDGKHGTAAPQAIARPFGMQQRAAPPPNLPASTPPPGSRVRSGEDDLSDLFEDAGASPRAAAMPASLANAQAQASTIPMTGGAGSFPTTETGGARRVKAPLEQAQDPSPGNLASGARADVVSSVQEAGNPGGLSNLKASGQPQAAVPAEPAVQSPRPQPQRQLQPSEKPGVTFSGIGPPPPKPEALQANAVKPAAGAPSKPVVIAAMPETDPSRPHDTSTALKPTKAPEPRGPGHHGDSDREAARAGDVKDSSKPKQVMSARAPSVLLPEMRELPRQESTLRKREPEPQADQVRLSGPHDSAHTSDGGTSGRSAPTGHSPSQVEERAGTIPAGPAIDAPLRALSAGLAAASLPRSPQLGAFPPRTQSFPMGSVLSSGMAEGPARQVTISQSAISEAVYQDGRGTVPGNRSLEDVVTDMLKPLLIQWLEVNMPRIVERALRVEAAKSSGRDSNT